MSTLLSTARGFGKRDSFGKRKMSTLLSTARGFGKRSAEVAVPRPPVPDHQNREPIRLQQIEELSPYQVDTLMEVLSNWQGTNKRSNNMLGTDSRGKRKMSSLLSTARGFGKRASSMSPQYLNVLETLTHLKLIEELSPEEMEDVLIKLGLATQGGELDDWINNLPKEM